MENTTNNLNHTNFLGTGWAFPPQFSKATSSVNLVTGQANVKRSLEVLLTTQLGERTLHPNYGSNLYRAQFGSIGPEMQTNVAQIIETAIVAYEPRVIVEAVTIEASPQDNQDGRATIHVTYRTIQTNVTENLVFPYYLTNNSN